MEIIIPCAGLSTRFPNMKPKYLLIGANNKLMLENVIENITGKYNITVILLREHVINFNAQQILEKTFGNRIKIVILENPTSGPADTVYQGVVQSSIDTKDSILIKDCDSFYNTAIINGNAVYVAKIDKNPNIHNLIAKSFTISNDQGIIHTVVEKQIVSNSFCAGGYQFETAKKYLKAFEQIKHKITSEIFVSNIVDYLITSNEVFVEQEVTNYVDVGTLDDWNRFNKIS